MACMDEQHCNSIDFVHNDGPALSHFSRETLWFIWFLCLDRSFYKLAIRLFLRLREWTRMIYLQSIFATVVDPVLCDFMYTTWFCLEHVSLYFLFTFPVPSIDFRFTFPVGTSGCTAALYASLTSRDLLMTSTNHAQDCSEMPSKIRRTNVRKRYLCLKTIFNPYQIRIQKISVSPFFLPFKNRCNAVIFTLFTHNVKKIKGTAHKKLWFWRYV